MSDTNPKNDSNDKAEEAENKSPENGENEPTTPKEMRALVLTGFGGLKTVKVLKKPEPTVAEGEVLINVKACGLNFQDLMVRLGAIDSPPKTPFILGLECSGVIEEIGAGVDGFKVGDRVAALPEYRAWAEYVAVPAKYVYKIPDDMSFKDAAAITLDFVVAYILLFELGNIAPGKKVLLHSAGGGVGQAVVQLCKTVGDVTVFGVASKGKHEALTDSIDHLLERGSDYSSEVRNACPKGIDLVLDCLCGEECNRGFNLLAPMGKYILFGSSNVVTGETKSFFSVARAWWQVDKVSPIKLFEENKTLCGLNLRQLLYRQNGADYVRGIVEKVWALYEQKKIKPVIDSVWAWEDIAEAMQKLHDRKNIGKVVLDPAQEPKPKPVTPAKGKKGSLTDKECKKDDKNGEEALTNGQHDENNTNTTAAAAAAAASAAGDSDATKES